MARDLDRLAAACCVAYVCASQAPTQAVTMPLITAEMSAKTISCRRVRRAARMRPKPYLDTCSPPATHGRQEHSRLPAGDAHVARDGRASGAAIDDEVVAFRLQQHGLVDRRVQGSVVLAARSGARRSTASSWPRHMNSVPVQVRRTRLQLSQKLCVIGVMKPRRPPVSAIDVARRSARAMRDVVQRPAVHQPRAHDGQRQVLVVRSASTSPSGMVSMSVRS